MTDANDFVLYDGTEHGLPVRRELSCGSIPYVRESNSVILLKGAAGLAVPKGRIKIVDGFPEGPLECAVRETREELPFLARAMLPFNGFYTSLTIRKDTAAPARAYKRIALFGLDVPADAVPATQPDAPYRVLLLSDALNAVDARYADALHEFSASLEPR